MEGDSREWKEGGEKKLKTLQGCTPNVQRAMLMSGGQLAAYDQVKQVLLQTPWFQEGLTTHIV